MTSPSRAMGTSTQGDRPSEAPPRALAKSRPQGRVRRTIAAKCRKDSSVSPAKMHSMSSGKKGNRKARTRKTGALVRRMFWYFSDSVWLTNLSVKSRPSTRASQKTSREPAATAPKVSRNAGQVPKRTPPAAAVILLGMGASTTDRNWTRKNNRWE